MKRILILWVIAVSLILVFDYASGSHESAMWSPEGLPVDNRRGPWFATIDLEAEEWAWDIIPFSRKGPTALKFEVRPGDCFTANPHAPETGWDDCTRDRERSEIREKWSPPLNREIWYEWSMYIPIDYEYIYPKQIVFQWHGGDWGPNAYFQLNRNNLYIDILTEEHQTTFQKKVGELPKGQWIDFVVRAVWTDQNNGEFDVWIDDGSPHIMIYPYYGKQVLSYRGPTMDPATVQKKGVGPHVKMGVYRSHLFRWTEPRPLPTHILLFDEYRRGFRYDDVNMDLYAGD